jgi:hypothetical protein
MRGKVKKIMNEESDERHCNPSLPKNLRRKYVHQQVAQIDRLGRSAFVIYQNIQLALWLTMMQSAASKLGPVGLVRPL